MIIIAVIGGLLVNLLSYLIKGIVKGVVKKSILLFQKYINEPLRKRNERKLYNKRLSEGKITITELSMLRDKVDNGTATDYEARAVHLKEKELNKFIGSPEARKQMKELGKKMKELSNHSHMDMFPNIIEQQNKMIQAFERIKKD